MLVVLGSRATLGVVLDAEDGKGAVAETFDRAVVQVALRNEEVAGRDRRRVHLELVVLAGDVHPARLEVFDRVVGAVVAEWQPRGARAGRATEDLMTEADAEDRDASDGLAGQLHRPVEHRRVTRPVGQDHPVRAGGLDIPPRRCMRKHDDATAAFAK